MAEHLDVVIVGAGLSGIGAACRLARDLPAVSFIVVDRRERIGGTWDLFRYPGVRADSDMATLGYVFRPWAGEDSLADGAAIRDYVEATAREHGVDDRIRFGVEVSGADWDSAAARWTVHTDAGDLTCGLLWGCTGYYDHDRPHDAALPGLSDFTGAVVHPQSWPADLDVTGRRVAIVGSGATAVTLVPALAPPRGGAAHVTMVQRTPTYVVAVPAVDTLGVRLRRRLPRSLADGVNRWRSILLRTALYLACRAVPGLVRRLLLRGVRRRLPEGYDVARDFAPPYAPWDQRLCAAPDGDLFAALAAGHADVVTGELARIESAGVRMADGRLVAADVLVTATGLRMLALGGLTLRVDGELVAPSEHLLYQGTMLDGVPNLVLTVGYAHQSWTLRADLVSEYVVRLLRELDRRGARAVRPRPAGPMATRPLLDLTSGYVRRAAGQMPRQGERGPWRISRTYPRDVWMLRHRPLRDAELEFS